MRTRSGNARQREGLELRSPVGEAYWRDWVSYDEARVFVLWSGVIEDLKTGKSAHPTGAMGRSVHATGRRVYAME